MRIYLWLAVLVLGGGAVALAMSLQRNEAPGAVEATAPSAVAIFPKALNKEGSSPPRGEGVPVRP
jgi:hypothetical protein